MTLALAITIAFDWVAFFAIASVIIPIAVSVACSLIASTSSDILPMISSLVAAILRKLGLPIMGCGLSEATYCRLAASSM